MQSCKKCVKTRHDKLCLVYENNQWLRQCISDLLLEHRAYVHALSEPYSISLNQLQDWCSQENVVELPTDAPTKHKKVLQSIYDLAAMREQRNMHQFDEYQQAYGSTVLKSCLDAIKQWPNLSVLDKLTLGHIAYCMPCTC
jgi:hypothetical protein